MKSYLELSPEQRRQEKERLLKKLEEAAALNLDLNMARGKPSPEQLDYVDRCFAAVDHSRYMSEDGVDCRNYGELFGLKSLRRIFADLLKTSFERVWCLGSSSLTIMYNLMSSCMLFPLPGAEKSWKEEGEISFLCPVPGYDRHFNICRALGIKMIPVPLLADGPDMDQVEKLCAEDKSIKGIWLVPMYSNPDGTNYSGKVLRRLFSMPAAPDFRIFADMAYCAHHLEEKDGRRATLFPLLDMAREAGKEDRVFEFASTSKITYAGSGVACLAMSERNQEWLMPSLSAQMISADKMNMLRHVQVFQKAGGIDNMMKEHRRILRSKFKTALDTLENDLAPYGVAEWTKPLGGYFITAKVFPGTAAAVVAQCKKLGVTLTQAGSTFPYGKDPNDEFLRIAPSYPSDEELAEALHIFSLVVRYEALGETAAGNARQERGEKLEGRKGRRSPRPPAKATPLL